MATIRVYSGFAKLEPDLPKYRPDLDPVQVLH